MTTATAVPMTHRLGATPNAEGTEFLLWSPFHEKVEVKLLASGRSVPLTADGTGYHSAFVPGVRAGETYTYAFDVKERPDPASRYQPAGVHGPSQVVETEFAWTDDAWFGLPLQDYLIYELHVGTFTPEGTFDAAISRLGYLRSLGITAVEVMPIAQFPGARNWGYDGSCPFAAQNSYGGPWALKRFVNACHAAGLAVVLDVVYNHLGPEGNYLGEFGPYFTDQYKTPWGRAINFDGRDSDGVRRYFLENALYWVGECHVDALRTDAVHAIYDFSAQPFLEELCSAVRDLARSRRRQIFTIAESDLNDNRILRAKEQGGFGYDAQWNDDFHHALHVLLTGDRTGYYEDFTGVADLRKAHVSGFVYTGQYSHHRRRRHGSESQTFDAKRFVVFSQNHDQIGNRMMGERLCHLVDFERQKLAAAAVLLSPFVPMLFMGEEYAETAPFQYFISHEDPQLVEAVRRGRRDEFRSFGWQGEPPDPQSEQTFQKCKIDPSQAQSGRQKAMFDFYAALIRVRQETPALKNLSRDFMETGGDDAAGTFTIRRWFGRSEAFCAFNYADAPATVEIPTGRWKVRLDSAEPRWGGSSDSRPESLVSEGDAALALAPRSFVLFSRLKEM